MSYSSGPNTVNDSVVFAFDIGDTANSYKGEPTTNLTPYSQDFSQWYGNLFGNWINSSVTVNASTAPDGTLTGNRFGDGYSRYTNSIAASTNTIYTFSVWLKNVSLTGAGVYLYWSFGLNGSLVSYGNGLSVGIGTLTNQWQRFSFSVTSPFSGINQLQFGIASFTGYGSNNSGQQFDAWGGQVEQKPYATQYLPTPTNATATRSTTQGLLDISGKGNTIDLANMTYGANNAISFDGTDDYNGVGNLGNINDFTVEIVFKSDSVTNYRNPIDCNWLVYSPSYSNIGPRLEQNSSGNLTWVVGDSVGNYTGVNVVSSGLNGAVYHYASITRVGSYFVAYYNGIQSGTAVFNNWYGAFSNLNIGRGFSTSSERWFIGKIPIVKIYNRALSATEIQNNYLQYKTRFNLS